MDDYAKKQYEYNQKLLVSKIREYQDWHKYAFKNLRDLSELIEVSRDIPLSSVYYSINHLEKEKSQVLSEINQIVNALLPKKQDTSKDTESKQDTNKSEAESKEATQSKQESNTKETKKETSDENFTSGLEDNDSDDFDLEEE